MRFLIAALSLAFAGAAYGHDVAIAAIAPPGMYWSFEPWVLICLGLSGVLYWLGGRRLLAKSKLGRRELRRQAIFFWTGWIALCVALVSPLDGLGTWLFSAHMLQHELMMIVAAPFLVLGRPFGRWIWALPPPARLATGAALHGRALKAVWRTITAPLMAWALHAVALWLWHAPLLFEAALHSNTVHSWQHASFLGSALLFWWAVLGDGRLDWSRGPAMLYIFTTMAHTGALGALLTWSDLVWYPSYLGAGEAFGLGALEDQQLGGLIMWVPGGLAYLIAGLALASRWFARDGAGQRIAAGARQ